MINLITTADCFSTKWDVYIAGLPAGTTRRFWSDQNKALKNIVESRHAICPYPSLVLLTSSVSSEYCKLLLSPPTT